MRVLVTGCYGFVGHHMVKMLVKEGYEVIATDHPKTRPKGLPAGAVFVPGDLTDPDSTDTLFSENEFDHACFIASVFNYAMARKDILRINRAITENCLRAARKYKPKVRCVTVISASVYCDSFKTETPLTEDAPMLPGNAYEESKYIQHVICSQYKDVANTEIYPMAIFGEESSYGATVVIQMMANNQLPGLPGGGKNKISLIHVTDVCRAMLFLLQKDEAIGKRYNIGGSKHYTIKELMQYLQKEFARLDVPVDLLPISYPLWLMEIFAWRSEQLARKYNHPPVVQRDFLGYFKKGYNFLVDTSAIRDLGFEFQYDDPIESGALRETLEWQRKEGII